MINVLFLFQNPPENPAISNTILIVIITLGIIIIGIGLFKFIEGFYVDFIAKKPLFRHFYLFTKDLNIFQKQVLENDFKFYKRLDIKQQKYFRHRIFKFLSQVEFTGKEGLVIDDEKKYLWPLRPLCSPLVTGIMPLT
ncbi:hypothetical protein N7U66_15650 [Lacinutrix neustonica]|uniref:Uncharacterized protein n=1 Tax=Lacinutrix neustonica TaxID=2980107 RepID=A0A9E8SCL6_9FLAO|nr:hypothetical protein [Lacinutrix neustonica]WAC01443.1 hypothetical protein N7U66_15650 [Lacinutrix neustonica]